MKRLASPTPWFAATLLLLCTAGAAAHVLYPNDPDPFCPRSEPTVVTASLGTNCYVRLQVEDVFGNVVCTLADGPMMAGYHALAWHGQTAGGDTLATGHFTFVLSIDNTPPYDPFEADEEYEEDATAYCGDDLEGPFRNQFAGEDLAVAFAVGLAESATVDLRILDADDGTLVRAIELPFPEPGVQTSIWDLRDGSGERVPGGLYICRMTASQYSEDILFAILPANPIHISGTFTDRHGVALPASGDPENPTILETPLLAAQLDFGRPLSTAEYEYLFDHIEGDGAFQFMNVDTAIVAPDTSGFFIPSFRAIRPWVDIYGPGVLHFPVGWADPPDFYVHMRHGFMGLTETDADCDTVAVPDPDDWLCWEESHEGGQPIDTFCLGPACPNPAAPGESMRIPLSLPMACEVALRVINTDGDIVRTLIEGTLAAGNHLVIWDLRDDAGNPVPETIHRVLMEVHFDSDWDVVCGGDVGVGEPAGTEMPAEPLTHVSLTCGPNPLPSGSPARIVYALPQPMATALSIHDVTGRQVRLLQPAQTVLAGWHLVTWDGRGADGRQVPSGIYWARLESGSERWMRRIVRIQ